MFNKTKIILASSSYSRQLIFKNNNILFTKIKPTCNEEIIKKKLLLKKNTPKEISLNLAKEKALSISIKKPNSLVVGSDTIIDFGGKILNKANNMADAKKKILLLSNKKHNIYSSAVVIKNKKILWMSTQKTEVKIRKLSEKEITNYLKDVGKNILSSVGCYQLEKNGPTIIENIKGDFFNVMGFPLFPFLSFLKKYYQMKI